MQNILSAAFYSDHFPAAKKTTTKIVFKSHKAEIVTLSYSSVEHITFQYTVGEDTIMQIYS